LTVTRAARNPRFGAIIFHADTPEFLERCLEHHLNIGIDRIFVSLNSDDADSLAVARRFESPLVCIAKVDEYSPDPFEYFDAARRAATAWAQTEWLLFVDSDEFWVPASGKIGDVKHLHSVGAYCVSRFNAPPFRMPEGSISHALLDPRAALLIQDRHPMNRKYLSRNPGARWINARVGPKHMVRPTLISRIEYGAHDFSPKGNTVQVIAPDDLLIVHIPFTSLERFMRKVEGIRSALAQYQHRLQGDQAWHWRRWVQLADEGRLEREFASQVVDAREIDGLVSRQLLRRPSDLFTNTRHLEAAAR
jgi:hypothetical protein